MIKINNLEVGDIIGTTSGTPLASLIKLKTWGWRNAFAQNKSSHIAVVVDRGHGLLYFAEMLSSGIALTEIHDYDHSAPRQHICYVGRHPLIANNEELRNTFNKTVLELHARKVKYGYDDLFDYCTETIGIKLRDKEDTLICSELPRVAFKACGIHYPVNWEGKCSPKDWQCFADLKCMTNEVIK